VTTRHLVDTELLPLIDLAPADPITHDNLAATRAVMDARFAGLPRPDVMPTCHRATGRHGAPDVPILIYEPPEMSGLRPAILQIHGGGMIAGKAELTVFGTAPIALGLGCVIASVDYRLAPETPFPGPLDDCYAALLWLFDHAAQLGIDPARVAVSGDSAGGGLATALAIMARDLGDLGDPRLAAQLLTYPMLDHRTGGPDDRYHNPTTGEFVWTSDRNQFGWEALRGNYGLDDARRSWFSPALATDLADLPPAWIGTGTLDLFFDECLDYARRLTVAGVATELHCYAGAVHGFNAIAGADVSKRFAVDYASAVDRLVLTSPLHVCPSPQ
jgi:acetyl esterase